MIYLSLWPKASRWPASPCCGNRSKQLRRLTGVWSWLNLLPVDPADADTVAAEVSLIQMADLSTTSVRLPNGSSSVRDVCVAPDGKFAYVIHILSRYRMPTTQLERGWVNTNALSVIDLAGRS